MPSKPRGCRKGMGMKIHSDRRPRRGTQMGRSFRMEAVLQRVEKERVKVLDFWARWRATMRRRRRRIRRPLIVGQDVQSPYPRANVLESSVINCERPRPQLSSCWKPRMRFQSPLTQKKRLRKKSRLYRLLTMLWIPENEQQSRTNSGVFTVMAQNGKVIDVALKRVTRRKWNRKQAIVTFWIVILCQLIVWTFKSSNRSNTISAKQIWKRMVSFVKSFLLAWGGSKLNL
mmetsp:Transcript_13736/g.33584  ORF Transcript_13736/g.33584 Transcript_13736/m.33584 type:complete len:230 (-) Transcript_13736:1174-1863(-)